MIENDAVLLSFSRAIEWCKDRENSLRISHITKVDTIIPMGLFESKNHSKALKKRFQMTLGWWHVRPLGVRGSRETLGADRNSRAPR